MLCRFSKLIAGLASALLVSAASMSVCLAFTEVPAAERQGGMQVAPQSEAQPLPGIVIQQPSQNPQFRTGDEDKGTEINIPGLGSIGVLPKMDFGLELLYGPSQPNPGVDDPGKSDDILIRGTIKHKF